MRYLVDISNNASVADIKPVISADGNRIVFLSNRDGEW